MQSNTSVIDNPNLLDQRRKIASALRLLWGTLIPEDCPMDFEFFAWLDRYDPRLVEQAIRRTADKARQRRKQGYPMDLDDLSRYTSATLRNMALGTTAPTRRKR